MNNLYKIIPILLILSLFLSSCAVNSVVIKPGYNFDKIKRVAVVQFKDPAFYRDAGSMVSELFAKYMLKTGYNIVERDELDALVRERKLFESGILNKDHLIEFGRISGVDFVCSFSTFEHHLGRGQSQKVQLFTHCSACARITSDGANGAH